MGGFIHLWDVASGINLATQRGHTETVSHITFSPDGNTLASASHDKTARLWDVSDFSKRPLKPVDLPADRRQALWEDLAGKDAGKAHRAIWTLAADGQTTAFLGEHLKPSTENNRPPIDRLLRDLDDDRFAVRQKSQRDLERLGSAARPALLLALQTTSSLEVRKRIRQVLERLKEGGEPPEVRRTLRGIEVLELIGSPEARQVLDKLAQGAPGTASTEEARASCRRLKNRRRDWTNREDHP